MSNDPMSNLKRRIARFKIANENITDDPESVMIVMSKCIIVRAEQLFEENAIEYTAISPMFDEIPVGAVVPNVLWKVDMNNVASVINASPHSWQSSVVRDIPFKSVRNTNKQIRLI